MASFASPFTVFAATTAALPLFLAPATAFGPVAMISQNDTADITVDNLEQGATGTAYRFLTVTWNDTADQPQSPQYKWAPEVAEWVKSNYPNYIDPATNGVTAAFNSDLTDADGLPVTGDLVQFYDKLAAAIKSGEITPTTTKDATVTAEGGAATFDDVPMGGYLVLFKDGTHSYRPSVAIVAPEYDEASGTWSLPTTEPVTVKSSEVSLTKTASNNGAYGIGETVTFTVNLDVPTYPANATNKTYQFRDDLPEALTLNADSITIVNASNQTDLKSATTEIADATEEIALQFDYAQLAGVEDITITYSATVNSNAQPGPSNAAVNAATLTYAVDPYSTATKTATSTDNVYVYGIDLTKTDEEAANLPGATFTVKQGDTTLKFVKTSDGVYRLATADEASQVTDLAGNATTGKIEIDGLKPGEYVLTEIKAPNGYALLQNPVTVTIADAQGDGIVDANAATNQGLVAVTIENTKGFALPVTGAQGITLLVIGAAALITIGGVVLVRTRRKADQDA